MVRLIWTGAALDGLDEIAVTTTGQYGIYAVVGEAFPQIKANVYQRDPAGRIVVDGASGAKFLQTFKTVLEDPIRILV